LRVEDSDEAVRGPRGWPPFHTQGEKEGGDMDEAAAPRQAAAACPAGGISCFGDLCSWWLQGFRFLGDGSRDVLGRCAYSILSEAMTGKVNR
jgi:hypothetical protein